jgi:hypothetical protein
MWVCDEVERFLKFKDEWKDGDRKRRMRKILEVKTETNRQPRGTNVRGRLGMTVAEEVVKTRGKNE